MMKLGIGFTQERAEVSSPLLVYLDILASFYILHAYRFNVLCGNGLNSLSNTESNTSKCCPALPGAWVPTNAGTEAEPL